MTCCSVCARPYNPDDDIQRFCHHCRTWYHEKCLQTRRLPSGPDGIPEEVTDNTCLAESWSHWQDILRILRKPIFRGKHHGIVGHGELAEMAWKIYHEMGESNRDPREDDWQKMNTAFNECEVSGDMEDRPDYYYYSCPDCETFL